MRWWARSSSRCGNQEQRRAEAHDSSVLSRLQLQGNQEQVQDTLIDGLIVNITELIDYLTRHMTLLPGDVIATGKRSGMGRPRSISLKARDRVRITLDAVGTLENPVEDGD